VLDGGNGFCKEVSVVCIVVSSSAPLPQEIGSEINKAAAISFPELLCVFRRARQQKNLERRKVDCTNNNTKCITLNY
jgi:hypothetical protein